MITIDLNVNLYLIVPIIFELINNLLQIAHLLQISHLLETTTLLQILHLLQIFNLLQVNLENNCNLLLKKNVTQHLYCYEQDFVSGY